MSNLPIWSQPPPGSRKPRFTRDQIAAAALRIADKDGFEALSMRRIADALGAGTMTLYYYVRTKDDLLTLMDDALMGEVVRRCTPMPGHWRPALETIAHAMRDSFLAHPWALISLQGARVGPNGLMHIEQSLHAVSGLELPLREKLEMLSVVDDFVFGTVLRERESQPLEQTSLAAINDLTKDYLDHGDYPILRGLVGDREPIDAFVEFVGYMTEPGRFDRGLQAILDGFATRYGLSDRPARPRARAERPARPARPARPPRPARRRGR